MLSDLASRKIGVLLGGDSNEREISLLSGEAIFCALYDCGLNVVKIDVANNPQRTIKKEGIDIAFIALHGRGGEDGTIQRLLDELNIPYTGSDAVSSFNTFDKIKTKEILKLNKIPTPDFKIVNNNNWEKEVLNFSFPLFIKPVDDGSSIGVFLINSYQELKQKLNSVFKLYDIYMIEERIEGREITVGILNNRALPIIELRPKNVFYDFNAKYTSGKTDYLVPASFPMRDYKYYQKIALKTHKALGARDFSRIDIMVDKKGRPFVLELNSIPGFTQLSLLPKAAKNIGIDFDKLCISILKSALRRSFHGRKKEKKNK